MTLAVRDLHAYYGESHVLQGVSLDVRRRRVRRAARPQRRGQDDDDQRDRRFPSPARRHGPRRRSRCHGEGAASGRGRRGRAVPQGRRVFADLTVLENLTIAARSNGGGWDLARVLGLFPSLERRLGNRGDELSGGEQQMVAIGRALLRDPVLLCSTSPRKALRPKLVNEVGDALVRLRESGLALLLVEQNLALATRVAQRVYVMNKGTIVFSVRRLSSPRPAMSKPATWGSDGADARSAHLARRGGRSGADG
jgi:branched-chain amino acid transport system ATP-binding protein